MRILASVTGRGAAVIDVNPTDIGRDVMARILGSCDASISGSDALMWHSTHQVDLEAPLSQCGVREMSVIDVTGRVRGGGGDGGSTGAENRTAYMEMYKRKKVGDLDKAEESIAKWVRCTLSGEVLAEPVVCDEMGSLYNKEAVVHGLMEQLNGGPKMPAHLTLKTIIELKLSRNPAYKGGEAGEGGAKRVVSPFMCPITEHGFDGKHRFVVVRATGHVVAEKALKELPQLVEELVGSAVEGKDVIVLNGTEQERAQYAEVLKEKLAAIKAKKAKKDKKKGKDVGVSGGVEKKKWVAAEHVPEGANKEVWASLFIGDKDLPTETFTARGTLGRGVAL